MMIKQARWMRENPGKPIPLCGHVLGIDDTYGRRRVCYGHVGHAGDHGDDGIWAEWLPSDEEWELFIRGKHPNYQLGDQWLKGLEDADV